MKGRIFTTMLALAALSIPAKAQDRETPYWASLRANEINMRVGPSADYKIDWVYRRKGLPVKVVRVMEGWRLVQDPDGTQGWIAARLLSPERSAIVAGEGLAAMYEDADQSSTLKWRLEPGVVGSLGDCSRGWCELTIGNRAGWVRQERLWGTDGS
ncbi:SH3 domain-containing protein [Qipengyuania vesicularis]|uniref:SH3 domain-containing protein n=1 Tax=Qipengyuania vesicularis TaxID=2867232 RepID=UPI001C889EC9|nr:SH3 domain-containing protein [Qipengyuania vesicularis]MBX7526904.1 hypothetical protein [Qipengyuania vesicularis]